MLNDKFYGFRREDGSAGTRNHVLIIPAQRQLNIIAKNIQESVNGTKAIITLGEPGRPKYDRLVLARVFTGLGLNPNTASVLILTMKENVGYEELKAENIAQLISSSGKKVEMVNVTKEGGYYKALGKGIKIARKLVVEASAKRREPCGIKDLKISVKCGMSDATSGICGNPAVGGVFDKVVEAGGTCFFSETTEIIGAEQILIQRAKNKKVAEKIVSAAQKTEEKALSTGEDIRKTNPIPENIAGGLTTLEEKSIGAIVKSGNSIIQDVLSYGERPEGPGLYFVDAWMSSLSLPTGYAASGATFFIYQMGGSGIPGNCFPPMAVSSGIVVPIMYTTGNMDTYKRGSDTFDYTSGTVLQGKEDLEKASSRLLSKILEISSGTMTKVESLKYEDPVEIYFQGPVF